MKKLAVLGLLLAMSTGCGRGWFPHLFRGAPCNGLCSAPAPTLHNDCEGCSGVSSGYDSYDNGAASGGYDEGTVIGSGNPPYTSPTYQPITPGTIVSPTTPNMVMPNK